MLLTRKGRMRNKVFSKFFVNRNVFGKDKEFEFCVYKLLRNVVIGL